MKFYYMEGDDIFLAKRINKDVKAALDKVIKHFYDKHNIVVERVNSIIVFDLSFILWKIEEK